MSYVEKLLTRNERIVRAARDHWITLLPAILIDIVASIVIIGLSATGGILWLPWAWFGLMLLVVPLGHLVLRVCVWGNRQYIVTTRRILQVTGTFSKRVSDTLLEKINDIVMEQSALGRLLNFGDVEIISGSESGIDVFRRIADPIGFKKELLDQKETLASLGAFDERMGRVLSAEAPDAGDVPELIAELDELRQKGVITDVEFEEKKQRLLARI
ncbi:MAG: PH domain-containing protein [Chloroflexota bacterium]|nr:PH domain-containing protein [Chloroflexota bacterium]